MADKNLPKLSRTKYRYFAHRIVYAWERPSVMRKHIYTGAMGSIWSALISGVFFVYFGTALGMTSFEWGIMGGISSWIVVAQLLSAFMTDRGGRRKFIWFWYALLDRFLRLVGILVALWLWRAGQPAASVVLIVLICLANLFGNLANPPWMSWLADIVPENEHGRFWGRRSAWIAISTIGVVIPAGFIMDAVPEESKILVAVLVFTAATVIGVLDIVIHGSIPEPHMVKSANRRRLHDLLDPFRDPQFRPWLIFNGFWTFSMTLGGALATIYFITELGIKENFLGGAIVLTSFSLLGSILSGSWSGRLVDKLGSKRILFIGHVFWAILPAFWFFSTPQYALVWLGLGSLVGGSSSTAASSASTKLITRTPPPDKRATYAAASSTLGSLAGGIGIVTAGTILKLLEGWSVQFLTLTIGPFRLLFFISCILRLSSALIFIPRLRETPQSSK